MCVWSTPIQFQAELQSIDKRVCRFNPRNWLFGSNGTGMATLAGTRPNRCTCSHRNSTRSDNLLSQLYTHTSRHTHTQDAIYRQRESTDVICCPALRSGSDHQFSIPQPGVKVFTVVVIIIIIKTPIGHSYSNQLRSTSNSSPIPHRSIENISIILWNPYNPPPLIEW